MIAKALRLCPMASARAFDIFSKALDKALLAYYNESAVKTRQKSTKSMNTVRCGRTLSPRHRLGKAPSEDEESTVQIRHNSHCRKLPQKRAKVGMLIVPCRKALPGKWGRSRGPCSGVPSLPPSVHVTPLGRFRPWGVFYFIVFVRKNEKRKKQ